MSTEAPVFSDHQLLETFQEAVRSGTASSTLPKCPQQTWTPSYAYWRFLKRLQMAPHPTLDHGVLLRQAVRWSGNRVFTGGLSSSLNNVAQLCGIALASTGELVATSYRPSWLESGSWPADRSIDEPPVVCIPDEGLPSEPWLWAEGSGQGIRHWHSLAQKEACWQALTSKPGSTTLIGLPTGAGKSLIFQNLVRFGTGLTGVVVPTVALALDQWIAATDVLAKFPEIGVRYYAANDPNCDPASTREALRSGACRLLFTSPEACVSGNLRAVLDELAKVGRFENLVVDEAHIIDSWGGHFRVEFQFLSVRQQQWRQFSGTRLRTFLLSATFTPGCRSMLQRLFDGSPWQAFASQRLRPEMKYSREQFESEGERNEKLLEALHRLPRPLILYVTEVKEADEWGRLLKEAGFRSFGIFTGETRSGERRDLLANWRRNELDIMIATSAFGMGVDKQDVRAVVHACFPENLHRYYQEVGRGGRDGASSICLWLPTKTDREIAAGLLPRLLGEELINLRWSSLLETDRPAGSNGALSLPMNAKHQKLIGTRSFGENVKWNKRLLLMMARAELVDLNDLVFEQDPDSPEEWVERVSIIPRFPPRDGDLADRLETPRKQEKSEHVAGLAALDEYLSGNRPICRLLRREYGEETQVVCGGCSFCRDEGLDPFSVPRLEFDGDPVEDAPTDPLIDVVATALRYNSAVGVRGLAERARDIVVDRNVRRFILAPVLSDSFRIAVSEVLLPERRILYRLDQSSDVDSILIDRNEHVVCIHGREPDRQLLKIRFGTRVSHLFPSEARLTDANGRVLLMDAGMKYFTSIESWMRDF
jgi:ATP-dependent DNA helicase RecQ